MPKLHLTKSVIDELTPSSSELVYWDDSVPGFGFFGLPSSTLVLFIFNREQMTALAGPIGDSHLACCRFHGR